MHTYLMSTLIAIWWIFALRWVDGYYWRTVIPWYCPCDLWSDMSESLVGIHVCDFSDCRSWYYAQHNTPLHNELQEQQYAYIHRIDCIISNYTLKIMHVCVPKINWAVFKLSWRWALRLGSSCMGNWTPHLLVAVSILVMSAISAQFTPSSNIFSSKEDNFIFKL